MGTEKDKYLNNKNKMKAHLKTIGVFLVTFTILGLGVMFPYVVTVIVSLIVLAMIYALIYRGFKMNENDENELSDPFNAGGRERD